MTTHAATLVLLVTLSSGGYWFGGETGVINVAWPVEADMPEATLNWTLALGKTSLATGSAKLEAGRRSTAVKLVPPPVTTRVTMTWHWHLIMQNAQGDKQVQKGSVDIDVFPANLLKGAGDRLEKGRLVVLDPQGDLSKLLKAHEIDHAHVDRAGAIVTPGRNIILVAPGALDRRDQDQAVLAHHAESGSSVLLFAQHPSTRLMGYALSRRDAPRRFSWRNDHPLTRRFTDTDLAAWFERPPSSDVYALRLPPDEPAVEVGAWPGEIDHDSPAPIDALLVTRSQGSGRIVMCQLPFDFGSSSPRELLFLAGAIEYLRTRAEPTPAPSQRTGEKFERIKAHLMKLGYLGDAR